MRNNTQSLLRNPRPTTPKNKAETAGLGAEDDVMRVVTMRGAGNVAELDHVGAGDEGGRRPLGQLVAVVLQLRRQHRAPLVLQLLPPVHACTNCLLYLPLLCRKDIGGLMKASCMQSATSVKPSPDGLGCQ